jgi:flagellar basal-body rod modification protein FlgD
MDIASVLNGTSSAASTQTSSATKTVGKDEFLKLLVVQLQNQDPLNPMDSTGFTSQLAQFSSLEQLTNINTSITNLASSQGSMQGTLAAGLIGKNVKVAGNQVSLNGSANINYNLSGAAAQVKVAIYDTNGKLVRQVALGNQNAGSGTYAWDGKDTLGNTLPNGQYTVKVDAVDTAGKPVAANTLTNGKVTGLVFENNSTYLVVDGTLRVKLADVQEVSI